MPFVPSIMTQLMLAKATSQSVHGNKLLPQLSAVSSAVCSYFSTVPVIVSTNFVTGPGAGTYTGKVVGLVPSAMCSLMMLKMGMLGLVGRDVKRLFDAISFGVCTTILTTAVAQGTVIGGGPGAGQGKIIGLFPRALQPIILANLTGKILVGSKTQTLASAIAFGICNHVMTAGTVITACIGAFAPPPAGPIPIPAAPGPGRLV
jgi:hypothetical protein